MIEKKITQAGLADAADCHEKTIQNLMAGRPVRDQTLFDVCMVLGLDFEKLKSQWSKQSSERPSHPGEPGQSEPSSEIAPIYMGGYTQQAVDHFIGSYLTLRPSFTKSGVIFAFRTDITWDNAWPSLVFEERMRPDTPYSHRGRVHVPPASHFVHLISQTKGAMRMILLSQLDQMKWMRGIITTLSRNGAALMPVSAPIVYRQLPQMSEVKFGEITENDPYYDDYHQQIELCMRDGYAAFSILT